MLTADEVMVVFGLLMSAGLKPPAAMDRDLNRAANVWAMVLGDMTREQLTTAAVAYIRRNNKWFPSAGELRSEVVAEVDTTEWLRAWGRVVKLMGECGRLNAPSDHMLTESEDKRRARLDLPAIRRPAVDESVPLSPSRQLRADAMRAGIIAAGGWATLCNKADKSLEFIGKNTFGPCYQRHIERARRGQSVNRARALISAVYGGGNQIEGRDAPRLADFKVEK